MTPRQAVDRYAHFMRRIKYRTDVVRRCEAIYRSGNSMTGYQQTDVDLCYLQLRKCLEAMMLASVIAHDAFGVELAARIREKAWNASKLVSKLSEVNPRFYPEPVKDVTPIIEGVRKVERLKDGYLTVDDFRFLYDRCCGNMMHESRVDQYANKIPGHFREITIYGSKLVRLLNHHWIHVTEEIALAVLMQTQKDADVQVMHFEVADATAFGLSNPTE